jgi:uncharacterized Zn finger protein
MAAKSKSKKATSAQPDLPTLSEGTIRELATAKSFDRGKQYYQNGAITHPTQQENRIWADCDGSEVYQTSATLSPAGVADLQCTCPYDWGGVCKHEVALLLTYANEPQSFHVIPPLRELLAKHSRDDLLTLVERLLQQQPDLLTSLEIAAEVSQPAGKPIDTIAYRRKIQRALGGDDMRTIAKALTPALAMADQLYEAGDGMNAGHFYQILLAEIITSYDHDLQSIDHEGDVAVFSQDAAEGLGHCLADRAIDPATRQAWLNTLLEATLKEVSLGGVGFAEGSGDAIIEQATDAEWAILEVRIRQQISRARGRWEQDYLVGILAERLQHIGQDEAAENITLELSSPEQKLFVLLRQGHYDLAIAMAKQHLPKYPGLVTQFANALVAVGQEKQALQYITEQPNVENYYGEWLAKYHREHSDPKTALKFEEASFLQRPWLENYQRIQKLAESVGSWPKVRARLLKHLTEKKLWQLLIEIAIAEPDLDRAIKLVKNLPSYQQTQLKLKIAQLATPAIAIPIYEELVHGAIERKHRSAYQEAVRYLQAIQKCRKVSKTSQDWQKYIQHIRDQYPTLKALKNELDQI